jgi:phenylalanyl-tRNA synthetase alpha chain
MWDTFHTTTPGVILRTHTSPGQIHAMREYAPEPVRVILPGMCYRYEQVSARSETQFNQVEVLAVGRNITMGDLKVR